MSELVAPDEIESIVGVPRHPARHQARAVSDEETVYILHSRDCLDSGVDLRYCRFSLALDNGIRLHEWTENVPVFVQITGAFEETRLIPDV